MEDEIILHPAAQKLVDDPTFLKIIEAKIKSITNDGQIDKKDIPDIVVLVVYCTNNLKKFNLNADTLGEVLEDTIMYLLCHFKVLPVTPEDKSSEFRIMTKSIINLVMMQPKFKSCFNSIINFILCRNK